MRVVGVGRERQASVVSISLNPPKKELWPPGVIWVKDLVRGRRNELMDSTS